MARQISDKGIALMKRFEGFRADAYPDPGHGWTRATIGYGHTAAAGPPNVVRGMTVTRAEAMKIFRRDLRKFERSVERAVKVPLRQHQFDACVSLAYNIGAANFRKSSVLKHINAGDMAAAARAFGNWTRSNGRVMRGLVRRRKAEARLFANASRTYRAAATGMISTGATISAGALIAGDTVVDIAREVSGQFDWGKYLLLAVLVAGIAGTLWGFARTLWVKADERRAEQLAHDHWVAADNEAG